MRIFSLIAVLGLLLSACHRVAPERMLDVRMEPSTLKPGQIVEIIVKPVQPVELQWVSGTVKLGMGAVPEKSLKYEDACSCWKFKTMIPVFVTIPAGKYEIKAWGETENGDAYSGSTMIEVK